MINPPHPVVINCSLQENLNLTQIKLYTYRDIVYTVEDSVWNPSDTHTKTVEIIVLSINKTFPPKKLYTMLLTDT